MGTFFLLTTFRARQQLSRRCMEAPPPHSCVRRTEGWQRQKRMPRAACAAGDGETLPSSLPHRLHYPAQSIS
jgi:hypothetical protein